MVCWHSCRQNTSIHVKYNEKELAGSTLGLHFCTSPGSVKYIKLVYSLFFFVNLPSIMWTQIRTKKDRRTKIFSFLLACHGAVSTCVLWFCRSRVTQFAKEWTIKDDGCFLRDLGFAMWSCCSTASGVERETKLPPHRVHLISWGCSICSHQSGTQEDHSYYRRRVTSQTAPHLSD